MTSTALLAQLYALRSHLDAVILTAEADVVPPMDPTADPNACPNCHAPADRIEDASTLDGTKRNRCTACGIEWLRGSTGDAA